MQAALRLLQRSFGRETSCTAHLRYTYCAATPLSESKRSESKTDASGSSQDYSNGSSCKHNRECAHESNAESDKVKDASGTSDTVHDSPMIHNLTSENGDEDNELFPSTLLLLCDSGVGDRVQDSLAPHAIVSRLSVRCLTKIAESCLLR